MLISSQLLSSNPAGVTSVDYPSDNFHIPGVDVSEYSTPATENQILDWYQQAMTGWTLEQENSSTNVAVQKYMYEQNGFLLLVFPNVIPNLTCFVIATGPWSLIQACGSNVDLSVPGPFFAPGYGTVNFTVSPVDVNDTAYILPMGNMDAPGHTFPADHIYWITYAGFWNVYAPANGVITGICWENSTYAANGANVDYTLYIDYTSTFETAFYHLAQIAPWIMNQINQTAFEQYTFPGGQTDPMPVDIPVTAGEVVASAVSYAPLDTPGVHHGFEMAAYDATYQSREIILSGWLGMKCTVCPLNYFEPPIQNELFDLCNRTAEPIGGVYDYDQFGKLIGTWMDTNHSDLSAISFSYNYVDPTVIQVGISPGPITSELINNGIAFPLNNSPDPANISPANGTVAYYLGPWW